MSGHTPTPWHIVPPDEPYADITIAGARDIARLWLDDAPVHDFNCQQSSNAEFIVRAVNAHDDLLAACEDALSTMRVAVEAGLQDFSKQETAEIVENHSTVKALRNAIAKARGETTDAS